MPTFSKFISGRTGCQQLLDSDGYIYSRKKDKDSALKSAWRCSNKLFARASRLVVFLAFVPVTDFEVVFYEITYYIQTNYPKLMCIVNYFEKTYLGSVIVDSEVRLLPAYPLGFWNHFARIIRDPEFPRTSNMVEGFHRGFKSRAQSPLFKSMCGLSRSSRSLLTSISTGV